MRKKPPFQARRAAIPLVLLAASVAAVAVSLLRDTVDALSGFLFVAAVLLFLAAVGEALTVAFRAGDTTVANVRLVFAATTIAVLGAEAFLRYGTTRLSSYQELNGLGYGSVYFNYTPGRFRIHAKSSVAEYDKTEFSFFRQTNSLGLSDHEPDPVKGPDEFRIVALGDSFTEGVGTTLEGSWPKVVETALREKYPGRTINVINAGISGSDPVYEYVLLKERLLALRPDLVLLDINTSDLADIVVRGGEERIAGDGPLRPGPRWEFIYARSYIVRGVIKDLLGYSWLLIPASRMPAAERQAAETIRSVIGAFQALCDESGIGFAVIINPMQQHIKSGKYGGRFDQLVEDLHVGLRHPPLDLLETYRRGGVITPRSASRYYFPFDLHHTPDGYRLMGDAVAAYVEEAGLLNGR